ncbi:MAG: gfo/Idh/MocA family oxidoreductase [Planctomycetota bacterium]|nr:MAG: gfo/Idh/MocA family oxidoreductase [Planctomycetota bacterium]
MTREGAANSHLCKKGSNPVNKTADVQSTRRSFLGAAAIGAAFGAASLAAVDEKQVIPGFEGQPDDPDASRGWQAASDRKIRVGIAGYGVCRFGAAFGFQVHPNVEVTAVTDLIPERREALAKACRCGRTFESCEKLLDDDSIEAVFVATDAPSHARLCIEALKRGKHVACAVPAVFGSLEDADKLLEAVKTSGRKYMLLETSYYHAEVHGWRELYRAGALGKLVYTEGEYYHWMPTPIDSFQGWRVGLPPQWYPTHSNAYYVGVAGGSFTEVSCMGMPSVVEHLRPENNPYRNPFGTEIALFRTSEGGMARMAVSWDTPAAGGETGRIRGQKNEVPKTLPKRPPLPPGVAAGGHGGSHGYLMSEFVDAILRNRQPLVDIAQALAMTASGIVAHQSALKNGELLKIPQYKL